MVPLLTSARFCTTEAEFANETKVNASPEVEILAAGQKVANKIFPAIDVVLQRQPPLRRVGTERLLRRE